jgi:hypothetical protein
MSVSKPTRRAIATVVVALSLAVIALTTPPAAAATANDLDAFVGRWLINPEKTRMGRLGPNGQPRTRANTFTWVFTADGAGLRWDIYAEYPLPAPTRSMALIPDGKVRPCLVNGSCLSTGGEARDQSYAHFKTDTRFLTRVFYSKGQIVEYNTYTVSNDGKVFTTISWSPANPERQNIQVFDRQP